tara:strand:- start:528 stop:1847 length:1320 start_codon:yes stop_codon:yes gene_type:complete
MSCENIDTIQELTIPEIQSQYLTNCNTLCTIEDLPIYIYPFIGSHDAAAIRSHGTSIDTPIQAFTQINNFHEQYDLGCNYFDLRIEIRTESGVQKLYFHHGIVTFDAIENYDDLFSMIDYVITNNDVIMFKLSHCLIDDVTNRSCSEQYVEMFINLIINNTNAIYANFYKTWITYNENGRNYAGLNTTINQLKSIGKNIIIAGINNIDLNYDREMQCLNQDLPFALLSLPIANTIGTPIWLSCRASGNCCDNTCIEIINPGDEPIPNEAKRLQFQNYIEDNQGPGNICRFKQSQGFWQGPPISTQEDIIDLPSRLANATYCGLDITSNDMPIQISNGFDTNNKIYKYLRDNSDITMNILLLNNINDIVPNIKLYLHRNIKLKYNIYDDTNYPTSAQEIINQYHSYGIDPQLLANTQGLYAHGLLNQVYNDMNIYSGGRP